MKGAVIIDRIYRTLQRLFETATVDPFQYFESELNIPNISNLEYHLQYCLFQVYSTQSSARVIVFNPYFFKMPSKFRNIRSPFLVE